jgi:hypothetical protein
MNRYFRILFCLLLANVNGTAQQHDDVVLKAMQDELARNMKELHDKEFDRPFYIGYMVSDQRSFSVSASLGAIINSEEGRNRFKNVRVLVGDYDFNDESLDNTSYNPREENEIELPLDDDYYGIRRSLWATTDYVYKGAARQYRENLQTRKEKESEGEFNHRMFGRVPVVNLIMDIKPLMYEKTKLENLVRELSAIFLEFPELDGSAAYLSINQITKYTVTSEGTIARVPEVLCTMQLFAGLTRKSGEDVYDHLSYHAGSISKLPAKDDLIQSIRTMCKKLQDKAPSEFDDEYTGPVLFSGGAVADVFSSSLFGYRDKLVATEMIPDPKSTRKDLGMESKIDKSIVSEDITITVKSPLSTFHGQDVLGSYVLDGEGVRPDPELVIVQNGILKNLINDRSISQKGQTANGHNDGPGVVEVTFSKTLSKDGLKKKLIEIAKAEGLEFGVIISTNLHVKGSNQEVYKVFVSDGHEELVGAVTAAVIMKNLKKDIFASSDQMLFNIEGGPDGLVSYIVPSAVLLAELEVKKVETSGYERELYVASPLIKEK